MSLAQTTEIIPCLPRLAAAQTGGEMDFRPGLALGVVRFALSAMNTKNSLLSAWLCTGASFVLVFITRRFI